MADSPLHFLDRSRSEPRLTDRRLLDARFTYDDQRIAFFLNIEGLASSTPEEVEEIRSEIERRLSAIGEKVGLVANYDNFNLRATSTISTRRPCETSRTAFTCRPRVTRPAPS